jgi:hypothetical protein
MTRDIEHDQLLLALRDARPEPQDGPIDDDAHELLARIIGTRRAQRRRLRWTAAAAVTVAAALAIALVVTQTGPRTVDIALVAARSQDALRGTGRALVDSVNGRGLEWEQRARTSVAFDGDDLEMVMEYAGEQGRPGFTAHNRTVGGEFYLLDGPPGRQRWIHDTNASGTRGADLFSLDPRTLCELLSESAEFEVVDEQDGVKHIRATSVDHVPPLSFGEGPSGAEAEDVTRLELWIGPDDVVQRIDLDLERTETTRQGGKTILVPRSDGTMHKMVDPNTGEMVTTTHRSSYSVRFFDVGDPVQIVVPADAVPVAGQG